MKTYKRVLTIAGSDSGGGAGIQADLKTISACGCYGASAITALTVQNTVGVRAIHIPPLEIVTGQIEAVIEDIGVDAIKIGMLPTEQIICAVTQIIRRFDIRCVVLDPVMIATSGDRLISQEAANALIGQLMPLATVVTPNIPEAIYMTHMPIECEDHFRPAARKILSMGAKNVLLKAGHLSDTQCLTDCLYSDGEVFRYAYDLIDTPNTHGTGCTLSSAIAAYLALGEDLPQAVAHAEEYLHEAIVHGADYHIGVGHGPVDHFYMLR